MNECLHDLLEKPPCFFLGDAFRNALSKCLPFDELLPHNQKVYTSRVGEPDHLNVQRHLGFTGKDLLLMGKSSDGEPLRSFEIHPKMAFILGRRFFVTGTLRARAISVTKVDVRKGSVAVWIGTEVVEIDAEQVLRVVRPASRGTSFRVRNRGGAIDGVSVAVVRVRVGVCLRRGRSYFRPSRVVSDDVTMAQKAQGRDFS